MKPLYNDIQYTMPGYEMQLTEQEKKRLVELDAEYGRLVKMFRTYWCVNFPTNAEEEYEKFIKNYHRGIVYNPIVKIDTDREQLQDCVRGFDNLINEFGHFRCFLSKYYISQCQEFKYKSLYALYPDKYRNWYKTTQAQTPSLEDVAKAKQVLIENPYKEPDKSSRNINAEKALKYCEKKIKRYEGFKVQMKKNQLPRMSVRSEEFSLNISPDAMFSEVDLMGLNAHEIRGHVARRYYGAKHGLWLMVYGIGFANTYDEGIAVYNSLHRVSTRKPNILFNIALKTYISSLLPGRSFYEIFDILRKEFPAIPDKTLFKSVLRSKRANIDTGIPGGNGADQSYFCGYLKVKDMTQKQRDLLTHYNIGPEIYADLDDFIKFFSVNKFNSLI